MKKYANVSISKGPIAIVSPIFDKLSFILYSLWSRKLWKFQTQRNENEVLFTSKFRF